MKKQWCRVGEKTTAQKKGTAWFILRKNSQYYYELNETAGFIWSLLSKERDIDELVSLYCKRYQIPKAIGQKDVDEILSTLRKEKLIERSA